jgi:hypothetical protein
MTQRLTYYTDFWPYYLGQHRRPGTRICHYAGTMGGLSCLAFALVFAEPLWGAAALIAGYGPAWLSHAVIERNRPATFRYPVWSLASDLRMAALMTLGRLEPELRRYNIRVD